MALVKAPPSSIPSTEMLSVPARSATNSPDAAKAKNAANSAPLM